MEPTRVRPSNGTDGIRMDTGDFDSFMSAFREGSVIQDALYEAAFEAAKIISTEAKVLAGRSEKPHYFYGRQYDKYKSTGEDKYKKKYLFNPGNLRKAIYHVRVDEKCTETVAVYKVSWNMSKAPYGLFKEFGLSPYAKSFRPFMRPAIINKTAEAQEKMRDVILKYLGEL